ncbi:MAG TPA: hypothetical protein VEL70_00285 [Candidatus Acidoferrum sp.]|nr:hypothetical protein [Candidatus Acidoferrum sp.]
MYLQIDDFFALSSVYLANMPYYHKHFAPLAAYKTIKTLGRRENENANTSDGKA